MRLSVLTFLLRSLALAQPGADVAPAPRIVPGAPISVRLGLSEVLAVATAPTDGGFEHELVLGPGQSFVSWVYHPATLTFFIAKKHGIIRLWADGGTVEASGTSRVDWPAHRDSWTLSRVRPDVLLFTELSSNGCPGNSIERWLSPLDGGLVEVLRTGGTGEGGGDKRWFDGSIAVWGPLPSKSESIGSLNRFGPAPRLAESERVTVFAEDVSEGRLCRATRTSYRDRNGRLELVLVETLAFDGGLPSGCANE